MSSKQCIIIGASAAGMSAAIYLKRRGIDFELISKDVGGEMALSGIVENWPGIIHTTGLELTQSFKQHIASYDIVPKLLEIQKIEKSDNGFLVTTSKEAIETQSLILATGGHPKKLGVPGETEFYHKGLSYCTVCDGPIAKGKPVAIIGGANSALEAALMMSKLSPTVFLLTKNAFMKGENILIEEVKKQAHIHLLLNAVTKEISGDQFVTRVSYTDAQTQEIKTIDVQGVFIHIGLKPNSDMIADEWGVKNKTGEIVIDITGKTQIPGFFAAGDVTHIPYKQLGIAAGQGITAALSAINYLNTNGNK